MVPSSRPTSRLSYSEVARFGQPPESRHSAAASIYQPSPKSPTSPLEPRAPPLSAAPSASSTYLGTPSEITLLPYKEFTSEARDRDRHAILWRAARTQPNTPLLGVTNDSSISLPTDYEFRAELVDDGVGGAIARVPRFSTSILSKSPSLLSTGPSSPLSLPEGSGSPAVFASQTMLRSASLPIPNQLSYESFEAGLIAKERLAGSVELTGEAPPAKMSPAAKSIIPVKGFNSSTSLAPARDRYRSRSDSYILRPHYSDDADDDELQDEDPSFEVEDLSLSFSVGEDDFVCPSPSLRSNGLDTIQLLGGIFGIVVDEGEGEPPGSPDQTAIRDSEKENHKPGRPIGAVKTPSRPERLGNTGTTPTGHFPKPIPIVDDRSPLSDRSGQSYLSTTDSTMLDGTPAGRLFCPEVPSSQLSRNTTASTSSTRQRSLTQPPFPTSDARFVPSSTGDASIFQDNSEEILYIPPRSLLAVSTQPEFNNSLNLVLETTPGNAVVREEVCLRRSGGSIGVIGEEVRNALARSTGSTSSTRSSRSSPGDLTIKPSSHGAREIGEMDPRSRSVPEAAGSRLGHPSTEPTFKPLATHTLGVNPNDFESSGHGTDSPGRPIHLHLSGDDSDQHLLPPDLPPPPRKGFISPSSELEPARAPSSLRRVPIRRVSQEPAPSLPVIAEVSISLSSPPISPSIEASPNQQPTQPSDALPPRARSNTWSFAPEERNAVKIPSLQLGTPLPVQVNPNSHVISADDLRQLTADEQRDLRLRDILDHWEDIPNWVSTEDWVKTASSGTMDLKSVYDLVDRQEMETILDFAHHSRFLMDLEDSTQPTLTLKSVFNPSRTPFRPSVTQPQGAPSRSFGGYYSQGWPHHEPSVSQEGKPKPVANNKVSPSANPSYNPASTNARSYSRLPPAGLPKLHTSSAPFRDPTAACQRDTSSHPTTASTLLQSFQPQVQTHSSSLFPIPLLSESPQADYYPYSSYMYNATHPHSSNLNQTLLEHHQHFSYPFGPRFLAPRHSGIHR